MGAALPQQREPVRRQKELKFEDFLGETVELAEANARASLGDGLIGFDIVRDVQDKSTSAQGGNADETKKLVAERAPKEAFEHQEPVIIQEGQTGTVEVNEFEEFEAKKSWRKDAPRGAQMDRIECTAPPKSGMLGLGKKTGTWTVHWTAPYIAEVKYKMPALVQARYFA